MKQTFSVRKYSLDIVSSSVCHLENFEKITWECKAEFFLQNDLNKQIENALKISYKLNC